MEQCIAGRTSAAIAEADRRRIREDVVALVLDHVLRGHLDDPQGRERVDLTGLRHAIDIRVAPHGESDEFVAAQNAVPVVVERAQRVIAAIPEQPESDATE
jgi:hypothetical protein